MEESRERYRGGGSVGCQGWRCRMLKDAVGWYRMVGFERRKVSEVIRMNKGEKKDREEKDKCNGG